MADLRAAPGGVGHRAARRVEAGEGQRAVPGRAGRLLRTAPAVSDSAYSVNLAQTALMLPIGTAVPQPRQRIGTTRITQKRRE